MVPARVAAADRLRPEKLDEFTLSLLTNDEVLAIDQDRARQSGDSASPSRPKGHDQESHQDEPDDKGFTHRRAQVWAKQLEDGSTAVGLFNFGDEPITVVGRASMTSKSPASRLGRDLWRQKDLGEFAASSKASSRRTGAPCLTASLNDAVGQRRPLCRPPPIPVPKDPRFIGGIVRDASP